MQAVASISSGTLSIQINAQLYDTGLTDAISTNILNHVETIFISSKVVYESYQISFDSLSASSNGSAGVQEVQSIFISGATLIDKPFVFNFDGVDTGLLNHIFDAFKYIFYKLN